MKAAERSNRRTSPRPKSSNLHAESPRSSLRKNDKDKKKYKQGHEVTPAMVGRSRNWNKPEKLINVIVQIGEEQKNEERKGKGKGKERKKSPPLGSKDHPITPYPDPPYSQERCYKIEQPSAQNPRRPPTQDERERRLHRAEDRVLLSQCDLREAKDALKMLVNRFGSALTPELHHLAKDRVVQAKRNVKESQQKLEAKRKHYGILERMPTYEDLLVASLERQVSSQKAASAKASAKANEKQERMNEQDLDTSRGELKPKNSSKKNKEDTREDRRDSKAEVKEGGSGGRTIKEAADMLVHTSIDYDPEDGYYDDEVETYEYTHSMSGDVKTHDYSQEGTMEYSDESESGTSEIVNINDFAKEAEQIQMDQAMNYKVGGSRGNVALELQADVRSQKRLSSLPFEQMETTWHDASKEMHKGILPANLSWADHFVEEERRFEWWLLGFRNTDMGSVYRSETWDKKDYYHGPEVEELQYLYPVKPPRYTRWTRMHHWHNPHAVELGHTLMDDREWRLLTYECLLCCYHVLHTKMSDLELMDMYHRDIDRIDPAQFDGPDHEDEGDGATGGQRERSNVHAFKEVDEAFPQLSLELSFTLIRDLIKQAKSAFDISGSLNEYLGRLMVPHGVEGNIMGQYKEIHPLDLRYRVCRLMDHWTMRAAEYRSNPDLIYKSSESLKESMNWSELRDYEISKAWITRQLHLVYDHLLMKIHRASKFYWYGPREDSKNRPLTPLSIHEFSFWYERAAGGFWKGNLPEVPRFNKFYDDLSEGLLNRFVQCVEFCLNVVIGLGKAVEQDLWGCDISIVNAKKIIHEFRRASIEAPDLLRNTESIEMLLLGMTTMAYYDQGIRTVVAAEERIDQANVHPEEYRPIVKSQQYEVLNWSQYCVMKSELIQDQKVWINTETNIGVLDQYWTLELPILHVFLGHLWETISDFGHPDKIRTNRDDIACGIFIAAVLMQTGHNLALEEETHLIEQCGAIVPMTTHAVLAVNAIFWVWRWTPHPDEDDFDDIDKLLEDEDEGDEDVTDSGDSGDKARGSTAWGSFTAQIPKEMINTCTQILKGMGDWLLTTSQRLTEATPQDGDIESNEIKSVKAILVQQVTLVIPGSDTLAFDIPRGNHRRDEDLPLADLQEVDEEYGPFRADNDPDWFVINQQTISSGLQPVGTKHWASDAEINVIVKSPNLIGDDARLKDHYESLQLVRNDCEGVSLSLPSRVEKVMCDIMLRRMMSTELRLFLTYCLCNYRKTLEPESIRLVVVLHDLIKKATIVPASDPLEQSAEEEKKEEESILEALLPLQVDIASYESLIKRVGPSYEAQDDAFVQWLTNKMVPVSGLLRHCVWHSTLSQSKKFFNSICQEINRPLLNPSSVATRTEPDATVNGVIDEAEMFQNSDLVKRFGEAIGHLNDELVGEIELFADHWAKILPNHQHLMIVFFTVRRYLYERVNEMQQSPFWPSERLPPGADTVIKKITEFEALCREVAFHTGLENHLLLPSILDVMQDQVERSTRKKFDPMAQIFDRCIESETWKPVSAGGTRASDHVAATFKNGVFTAPGRLYGIPPEGFPYGLPRFESDVIIDYFNFINHVVEGVISNDAPFAWLWPSIKDFLIEQCQTYCRSILQSVQNDDLKKVVDHAERAWDAMRDPPSKQKFWGDEKKNLTKKKKGVGAIFGFAKGKKEITNEERVAAALADIKGGDFFEPGKKKKGKHNKYDSGEAEYAVLASRYPYRCAVDLFNARRAELIPNTEVPTFAVRLDNLYFYIAMVWSIIKMMRKKEREQSQRRHPEARQLFAWMDQISFTPTFGLCRKKMNGRPWMENKEEGNFDKLGEVLKDAATETKRDAGEGAKRKINPWFTQPINLRKNMYAEYKTVVLYAMASCANVIGQPVRYSEEDERALKECAVPVVMVGDDEMSVIDALVTRMVYVELSHDIFEDLYPMGDPASHSLTSILGTLDVTCFKFLNISLNISHHVFKRELFRTLSKAWMLAVINLGYEGYHFDGSFFRAVQSDLEMLDKLIEENWNVSYNDALRQKTLKAKTDMAMVTEWELFFAVPEIDQIGNCDVRQKAHEKKGHGLFNIQRVEQIKTTKRVDVVNMVSHISQFMQILSSDPYILGAMADSQSENSSLAGGMPPNDTYDEDSGGGIPD
eukprot:GHVH01009670.1.p1 GENE.GHVH01009670.1~~GHVH01009670.1.p1  ORF type:complete len:2141 (+),score=390.41 GHVH01009670.1:2138-8560(+)